MSSGEYQTSLASCQQDAKGKGGEGGSGGKRSEDGERESEREKEG